MKELPSGLKMATVWLLAGLAVFLGVQAFLAQQRGTRFETVGDSVQIRRAADGHYHWPATVNGRAVDFLVDTGATRSALPASLARELDLPVEGRVQSQTAGGAVEGQVVRADLELRGGVRIERLRIVALPALGAPLLGMDVLGKLHWQPVRRRAAASICSAAAADEAAASLPACGPGAAALLALGLGRRRCGPALPAAAARARRAAQWQAAQREARDVGLLWRISKDGRDSWLFGTIHVGKLGLERARPGAAPGAGAQRRAGAGARPHRPASWPRGCSRPRATRRRPTPALRAATAGAGRRRLPAADALQGLHPMLQLMTLTLLQARQDGLDAAFAQELMLAAAARAAGLRIVALESVDQQIGALLPADAAQLQRLLEQSLDAARARPRQRRCCAAWPRPGPPATWTRWSAMPSGANAPTPTNSAPGCAGSTTSAIGRWPPASTRCMRAGRRSLPPSVRCT